MFMVVEIKNIESMEAGCFPKSGMKSKLGLRSINSSVPTAIGGKDILMKNKDKMVVVPCPRCHSWTTSALDNKHEFWVCGNPTCSLRSVPFPLKKHHALVISNSGEVRRVDSSHPYKR